MKKFSQYISEFISERRRIGLTRERRARVIQSFLTGNDTPGLKSLKKGLKVLKQKKKQVKETVVGEETKKPWMRRSDDMASRISAAFMKAAGARRRADKMAKVTLNPKTKIGYEIRDVGPGGKSSVVKRENWPKKKNNVKEDTEQVYEILRDADDDFVDIGEIVEPINEGAVKAAMEVSQHSLKIARKTIKMDDVFSNRMGGSWMGMDKPQAHEYLLNHGTSAEKKASKKWLDEYNKKNK